MVVAMPPSKRRPAQTSRQEPSRPPARWFLSEARGPQVPGAVGPSGNRETKAMGTQHASAVADTSAHVEHIKTTMAPSTKEGGRSDTSGVMCRLRAPSDVSLCHRVPPCRTPQRLSPETSLNCSWRSQRRPQRSQSPATQRASFEEHARSQAPQCRGSLPRSRQPSPHMT
jgi:hypothetical protein